MDDKKLSPPSEEFLDAIIYRGSNVIECEFCERVHFVDDPTSDYEKGELDDLYNRNKENPDKVIFHDTSSVS